MNVELCQANNSDPIYYFMRPLLLIANCRTFERYVIVTITVPYVRHLIANKRMNRRARKIHFIVSVTRSGNVDTSDRKLANEEDFTRVSRY